MGKDEGKLVDSSLWGQNCFGFSTYFLSASRRYALAKSVLSKKCSQKESLDLSLLYEYLEFMSLECLMKSILEVDVKHAEVHNPSFDDGHNLFRLLKRIEQHLEKRRIKLSLEQDELEYFYVYEKFGSLVYQMVKYDPLLVKQNKSFSSYTYQPDNKIFPALCDKLYEALLKIKELEWQQFKLANQVRPEIDRAIIMDIDTSRKKGFFS